MKITLFPLLLLLSFSGLAQISLPNRFTDNMVLQREAPIKIWGKSAPGTLVKVEFSSEKREVRAKTDSTWQVEFPSQPANTVAQELSIISEEEKIVLNNILIGDVWLLSGQSNMEWPLKSEMHFDEEKKELAGDKLRFYNANFTGKGIYAEKYSEENLKKLTPKQFYSGKWEESGVPQIHELSAVGYYFGKKILREEKIPVGLINMAIGGAPIETFISVQTLREHPAFDEKVIGNWLENDALPIWIRERGKQNVEGVAIHTDSLGANHAYKPGFAYKSGMEPVTKMAIKGILWYQGESNAQEKSRVEEYPKLQKLMIEDYRKKWQQPKMPFFWVQLSSIDTINYKGGYWPEFRNNQRLLLDEMENVGMVVSSDIGAKNDVHPRNKKDVGNRLARWALNRVYKKNILVSGPLPIMAEYDDGKITISFKYTGKGLYIREHAVLKGFSLDGKKPISAQIMGDKVLIYAAEKPNMVYYGWQPYSLGNLINSEGLPASTFKMKL
ncbi:sialate O-acetylesterase [Gramella sp. AN32]|uniref:Sialate O-acetylesterase n=1 Tax=Christiangramia antarctica TaxID=2058158 RepID=A0ABW5X4Z7_9FLAO|nr:sialate O-acetylesterase [Gramella sp. AN32]MCM4157019.1 sialate O-acetylesterase [Gramella sp. AN32]